MSEDVDGPLDHLARVLPPWHTGPALTECGRPLGDVKSVVSWDAIKAKVDRQGKRRASFSTCMSCADTADRTRGMRSSWERFPQAIVERWASGAWRHAYGSSEVGARQRRELIAVGLLIEEHREEFGQLLEALGQTSDLADARRRARIRRVK
jgi:hypothetical protein